MNTMLVKLLACFIPSRKKRRAFRRKYAPEAHAETPEATAVPAPTEPEATAVPAPTEPEATAAPAPTEPEATTAPAPTEPEATTAPAPTEPETGATVALAHVEADLNANEVDIPMDKPINLIIRGKGNKVIVDKEAPITTLHITIMGDDNLVKIGKASLNMGVTMGMEPTRRVCNASLTVGDQTFSNGAHVHIMENDTHVSIGNRCMISWGVQVMCTDYHTILDEQGEVINKARSITIGNHVWISHGVMLSKKAVVADDCIVGALSVVSRKFDKPHCVIAGNPARVVKENVSWHKARPDLYPMADGLDNLP